MKANNQFKNILVFNPAYLGDTIITTPLIRALHVLYPKARISFCVRPEHADLFYNIPFIDEVIIFDNENITLEEYAKASNGITYEMISTIAKRVPRNFID